MIDFIEGIPLKKATFILFSVKRVNGFDIARNKKWTENLCGVLFKGKGFEVKYHSKKRERRYIINKNGKILYGDEYNIP